MILVAQYHLFEADVELLDSGHVALHWRFLRLDYTAQWSNPIWEALEWSIDVEHQQILHRLQSTAAKVLAVHPPAQRLDRHLAAVSLPWLITSRVRRWSRWWLLSCRLLISWLL